MKSLPANLRSRLLPIALAQLVGLACGIVGVKLNTRLIAPADYGLYGVFLSFTPLGMWVVHAGLVKFTLRHWAGAADRRTFWSTVVRAAGKKLGWLALAATLAALTVAGRAWPEWALLLFVSAAALSFGTLAQVALQADRRHWGDCLLSLGSSTTRTFLPPLLYWTAGGLTVFLLGGFALHTLFFAALAFAILSAKKSPPATATAEVQVPAIYSGPLFNVLSIANWSMNGLNRWLVALFFGVTTTGYFTLANNIALIVPAMLGALLTQYFQPEFFAAPHSTEAERRHLAGRVDRVALFFWFAALAGIVGLRLAMPWLSGHLIDLKYSAATQFIVPSGCFFTATITSQFYHQLLLAGRRESACGPVDLIFAGCLTIGGAITAWFGLDVLCLWLMATPLLPWLVSRPLARRYLLRPAMV